MGDKVSSGAASGNAGPGKGGDAEAAVWWPGMAVFGRPGRCPRPYRGEVGNMTCEIF